MANIFKPKKLKGRGLRSTLLGWLARRHLGMGRGSGVAVPRLSERLTVEINCMDSLQNHIREESMNVLASQKSEKPFVSQHISQLRTRCLQVSNNHATHLSKNLLLATPRPLSVIPRGNAPESFVLPLTRFDAGKKAFYSCSYIANENQDLYSRARPKRLKTSSTPYTGTAISSSKAPSIIELERIESDVMPMTGYTPSNTEGESSNVLYNGEQKILGKEKADGYINDAAKPHSKWDPTSRQARSRETDRIRRTRISEGIKALQNIIPYSDKVDKDSVLDDVIDYIKYLKLQMKLLSQSRLCGEATPYPFVHLEVRLPVEEPSLQGSC